MTVLIVAFLSETLERLRHIYGKQQNLLHDYDFMPFAADHLPFLRVSEGKQFRVSHKHWNYFELFLYTKYFGGGDVNGNLVIAVCCKHKF